MNCKHGISQKKKQRTKDYILYESIDMTFWKKQNYRDRNQINCRSLGEGRKLTERAWENFKVIEILYILIVAVVIWLCTFFKTHKIVDLKRAKSAVCKLYLNNCDLNFKKYKLKRKYKCRERWCKVWATEMSSGEGAVVEVDLRMQFKGNKMSILLSQCSGKERG